VIVGNYFTNGIDSTAFIDDGGTFTDLDPG